MFEPAERALGHVVPERVHVAQWPRRRSSNGEATAWLHEPPENLAQGGWHGRLSALVLQIMPQSCARYLMPAG